MSAHWPIRRWWFFHRAVNCFPIRGLGESRKEGNNRSFRLRYGFCQTDLCASQTGVQHRATLVNPPSTGGSGEVVVGFPQ